MSPETFSEFNSLQACTSEKWLFVKTLDAEQGPCNSTLDSYMFDEDQARRTIESSQAGHLCTAFEVQSKLGKGVRGLSRGVLF